MEYKKTIFQGLVVLDSDEIEKSIGSRELWDKPSGKSFVIPSNRRNHIAAIVNDQMIIHGGVSDLN